MPKVFLSSIGYYELGPMGSPGKNADVKKHNAIKSVSISLKDLFYYSYVAKLKGAGSLSYSTTSNPFDVSCAGDQYCKNQITSVSNTKYSVKEAKDIKISNCAERNPKCNTKEITTLELMFYINNSWTAKVESEYRVTNALGNCPTGPEIKNCSNKQRNCCQDTKQVYDEENQKWVTVTLSGNPDTTFSDYTYKVDSSISITIVTGGYLDDSSYIVQNFASFGGDYLYLNYPSDYNPKTCEKFNGKGTLTAVGKFITSYLYGQPCGTKGQAFLNTTWSASSKLNLMPP
jgi:hypothetical protein